MALLPTSSIQSIALAIGLKVAFLTLTGFFRVSNAFLNLYWVLLGFTGFHWVSLGFTGFHLFHSDREKNEKERETQ